MLLSLRGKKAWAAAACLQEATPHELHYGGCSNVSGALGGREAVDDALAAVGRKGQIIAVYCTRFSGGASFCWARGFKKNDFSNKHMALKK